MRCDLKAEHTGMNVESQWPEHKRTPAGDTDESSEASAMLKYFFTRSFFAFVLAASAVAAAPAYASDTRAEIATFMAQSAREWNAGNLDAFMHGYENSPATVYIGAKTIFHGYAAIRGHYGSHYGKTMGMLSFSDLIVRPLGPDYAVAVAHWHLAMADGTHPTGIFSLVLHRGPGGWHIIVDHSP